LISDTAELSCNKCANRFSVDSWDIDLSQTGSDERSMGPEVFYAGVTELRCPKCANEIELAHDLSEYPIGVIDYQQTRAQGALFAPLGT
jgi:restriction system protein